MSITLKYFLIGMLTGIVLVFVSVFGLVVGFIEIFQPLLSPGTELLRGRADALPVNPFIIGGLLNGLIYGLLFLLIATIKTHSGKTARRIAIALVLFAFLILTGMFSVLVDLFTTSDMSRLFEVGA